MSVPRVWTCQPTWVKVVVSVGIGMAWGVGQDLMSKLQSPNVFKYSVVAAKAKNRAQEAATRDN